MHLEESPPTKKQIEAARRLWAHANSETWHARRTGAFLLSLYDGLKYPVSLSSLAVLDYNVYCDCIAVLDMHYHDKFYMYLGATDDEFVQLAKRVRSSELAQRGT
jgi:hypothetical protein